MSFNFTFDKKVYSGWLDRKGIFYPVAYMQHREWAERYCEKNDIEMDVYERGKRADDLLLALGWMQFADGFQTPSGMHTKLPSKQQLKWYNEHITTMDDEQIKDFEKWAKIAHKQPTKRGI